MKSVMKYYGVFLLLGMLFVGTEAVCKFSDSTLNIVQNRRVAEVFGGVFVLTGIFIKGGF